MSSVFDLAGATYKTDVALASFMKLESSKPKDYRELAVILTRHWQQYDHRIIGLGGGQGSGKSTLSDLIEAAARDLGERVAVLGLDDFYLTRNERDRLANEKHSLFRTRGPPGTHDINALLTAIDDLATGRSVEIPQFDKGSDERSGTRRIDPPCQRVLVEGWCVGAKPQSESALTAPINGLERQHDVDGSWRREVNQLLAGPYAQLLARLDSLVYLRVPDLESVKRWRLQQEQDRTPTQRKDREWVSHFVQHYQRITEWMFVDAGDRADVVVELNQNHRVAALTLR
ncbi:MAG: kinase [Gammaproteobacteria bacterium]|nr:kinase [Gammaproteobacteria bacterium]